MSIQTALITNKIIVKIKSISPSVSVLYFTDETQTETKIPDDTFMYIYCNEKPTLLEPYMDRYFISCADNYELSINGRVKRLTQNRTWNLI